MEIIIRKQKITYTDTGKGFPIVFLPGITGNKDIWKNQTDELSLYFRVITLDFSEININFITVNNLTQIIDEISAMLNIEYFIICGYSSGALLAVCYANRYQHKTAGVCISSLGYISSSITEIINFYHKNIKEKINFFQKLIRKLFHTDSFASDRIYRFANLLKQSSIKQELFKLNHPLLIINGEFDNITCNILAEKIYSSNKDCYWEIIEKCGKNCFNTNFNLYNQILMDFFKKTNAPKY